MCLLTAAGYAGSMRFPCALALLFAASVAASPPELVARWTFEDGGHDLTGRGHRAKLLEGARAQGGLLLLDGEGGRAVVADHPSLRLRGPLTLAARVRPDSVRGRGTIVNKWYARDSYMLLVEGGHYAFYLAWPGGDWGTSRFVKVPAKAGEFAEVVGTWDGRMMRLYVDGILRAGAHGLDATLQDSDRPVVIGNHPDWNAFRGAIDEVRIYRGAVPEADVPGLFREAPSQGAPPSESSAARPAEPPVKPPGEPSMQSDPSPGSDSWLRGAER